MRSRSRCGSAKPSNPWGALTSSGEVWRARCRASRARRTTSISVIDLSADRIADLVDALGDDFEVDVDMLRDALLNARSCNIFYLPTVMKLDLFAVGRSPFDASEFARRSRVPVRPPAGTLVVKSQRTLSSESCSGTSRGSISERQWRDVVEVLRVSGPAMDRSYLESWADRLHLREVLGRAIGEASGGSTG